MATVSTALKMFDQMTKPLQQVTQALNLTISAMDNLNNSANRDIRITNTLNTARGAIQRASAGLQELTSSQDRAQNNQEQLNNSFNKGSNEANGLTSKVKNLIGAYLGFQAVKKGIDLTIGGGARLEQQLITISGMLGNKDIGKAFFGSLNKYANESVYGLKEFNTITRSFIQFTKNTDKLMDLNKTAEKLAFLDPTQGLEGAGFALKEALGGDFMSLKSRFGFGKADAEILKASKSMDEFISKFDELLAKKGATDKALEEFNQSAIAQLNNLKSNIETAFAQASETALEVLKPLLSRINEGFKNGSFEGFFNGISVGLDIIVNLIMDAIDIVTWLGQAISDNWSIISPIVWGLVLAMIAYNATMGIAWLTTMMDIGAKIAHTIASWAETAAVIALTFAQEGLNAALALCPITWIIIAIIILIALFYGAVAAVNHLAGTSISATGVIAGSFMVALAFIGNLFVALYNIIVDIIAFSYNNFAMFAEFLANVFNDPIGSIIRLFAGMADQVLEILQSIASAIDTIFGSNLANAVGNWQSGLQGAVDKLVGSPKIKVPRMDSSSMHLNRFEYGKAYDSGYGVGKSIGDKFDLGNIFNKGNIPDMGKMPDMAAWNNAQGPGTLGTAGDGGKNKGSKSPSGNKGLKDANNHLKNIDDKIDISNEHLEMMRDLAEMESIQNFVTLTPTVQVTTGDIKEDADINKIISKIETYMENELVNSAEGVYA
ncbi:hypothetical protein K8O96_12150 [Clostridium sporogenes]|uniref:Tail length tape measure protein n=1 Tax=Clostridium botulinum TaxID=1491 RepID=A0A6M0SVE1_CLOBO|nr:hypothetical protein [Clostridium sporogenes]NFA59456.1 hypothetical protein [Clostridium botulinum]NFI74640.1 hypothetical protein [Clostridium sporogenes]NFL71225.1 hypothetical protein [Clostridium sporogenes]NFM25388.1 hypothetical protein [Clostridium sporogenes]NFP62498.1 hypothetical protein [Clostridium sporogenes]